MNLARPIAAPGGRYRIHTVPMPQTKDAPVAMFQPEWQRNPEERFTQRITLTSGEVVEFISTNPWESTTQLFQEYDDAADFAITALSGQVQTDDPDGAAAVAAGSARRTQPYFR